MTYQILYEKPAVKFLKKQSPEQQKRIISAIHKLPHEGDIKQMKGYANTYRLRIGDYRAIYTLENNILTVRVLNIGNRGDIYKH